MPSLEPTEISVDIAIVGGGPTGLLTGLLCERLGASVCIVDSKPGTLELGRADALNARTHQYLEVVGILDELIPQGINCNTSSTYENGAWISRQNHWWTGLEYALHKNFLMIGQAAVEAAIYARIQRTKVLFSTNCTNISEDAGSVTVTTDSPQAPVIRAKYLVGADGARSTVRTLAGISFTGTKPNIVKTVLDCWIETDFPRCNEIVTFQLNGQSRLSWIPRENNMARFYCDLDLDPEQDLSQPVAEAMIREHMHPHKIDFVKTEWFSKFEIKERIASTFVTNDGQGRICLAGDAAHVHSVNGGQGLNTGIADAFALAWRLGHIVTKGPQHQLAPGAEAKLIRSYDAERRAVARNVIDVAARLVRDVLHEAKTYVGSIERNADYITGMGVSYDWVGSELIHQQQQQGRQQGKKMPEVAPCWVAGKRCPEFHLVAAAGQQQQPPDTNSAGSRIYALAEYGKYIVLLFGEQNLETDTTTTTSPVTFYKVLSTTPAAVTSQDPAAATTAAPTTGVVRKGVYTIAEPGLAGSSELDSFAVVVRPDMYIGYVGQGDGWKSYLGEVFA